jgi:putative acetyltransferase
MEDKWIEAEQDSDRTAVEQLQRQAFGEERVALLVRALRLAPSSLAPISLVARDTAGAVIGHVMLSGVRLDAQPRLVDVMTLSPLAVSSQHRRAGLGGALVLAGLAQADRLGVPLVFLEGDPKYYARHGFVPAGPLGFRRPSLRIPEAGFQVAVLSAYEPWMTGSFVYSETFWALDCVGLR